MFGKKKRKSSDPHNDTPGKGRKKAEFGVEPLEKRVLMSASWVDADTGDAHDGPTSNNDHFIGTEGVDIADGGNAQDLLEGFGGHDILSGGDGDDVLLGGDGDDILAGNRGQDTLDGGDGHDIADYSTATGSVQIDLTLDGVAQNTGADGVDSLTSIEGVIGSNHSDTFSFSQPVDGEHYSVDGNGGSNTIDLSDFSSDRVVLGSDRIIVETDTGAFSIDYDNVDHVTLSDGTLDTPDPDMSHTLDPVHSWHFTDRGVYDMVGDADGTLHGDPDSDGSGAAYFDGNDHAVISHQSDMLLNEGTVHLRFNADSVSGTQGLLSKDSTDFDDGGHLTVWVKNGEVEVRLQSTSASYTLRSSVGVQAGEWNDVAISFGSEGMQLFVNGELADTDAYTGGLGTNSGGTGNEEPIVIGANAWQSGDHSANNLKEFFRGSIAEVEIFGEQLEADQIAVLAGANVAPTDIDFSGGTVAENAAPGTVVATASAVDANTSDSHTYELVDDADGRFVIDASTGRISVADGADLDHESADAHEVTVRVTDSGGETYEESLSIGVTDSNEAPTDLVFSAGDPEFVVTADQIASGTPDGAEPAEYVVSGVPSGASLSAGTQNDDGTWTVPADQAAGVRVLNADPGSELNLTFAADVVGTEVQSTEINHSNFGSTDSGFTVTGRRIDSDGQLTEASEEHVISAYGGIAVNGATGGPASQIGYDAAKGVSEELIVSFDAPKTSVQAHITRLFSNEGGSSEQGEWTAYRDGVEVASATFVAPSGDSMNIEIDPGEPFDRIVFRATEYSGGQNGNTSDSSDFVVESITFDRDVETVTHYEVPVSVSADWGEAASATVTENAAPGTVVATVTVSDPDAGDTHTFELTDDADGRFTIDPETGTVTVAEGADLDHESASSHEVTVRVTDAQGETYEETLEIAVTDVNESPIDFSFTGGTVVENAEAGTIVGTVSASDPDEGDSLSYELVDDAGGRFTIDENGQIIVTEAADLNYEAETAHQVTVRITDEAGESIEEIIDISVANVIETLVVTGNETLHASEGPFENVVINGGYIEIDGDAVIKGDLTLESVERINGGEISLTGDVTTTDTSYHGTAVIVLTGDGAQSISTGDGAGELHNVSIENASGQVTIEGDLQISGSYADNGNAVDATGATLELQSNASVSGSGTSFGDVTINGGYFEIAEMHVDGDLTLESAARINGGEISVTGDVTTTDTSCHGTAVIVLTGDGAQSISTGDGVGELHNVSIENASGQVTIEGDLQISGSYADNGNTVDATGATLELQSNASVSGSGTSFGDVTINGGYFEIAEMHVDGDLTLESAARINGGEISVTGDVTTTDTSYHGTAVIVLTGDGAQTISTGDGVGELHNVSIENASGQVTIEGDLQISGSYADNGNAVDASGAHVTLQSNASVSGQATRFGSMTIDGGYMELDGDIYIEGDITVENLARLNGGIIFVAGEIVDNDGSWHGTGDIQHWERNDSPTDLTFSGGNVAENAIAGTVVANASFTDPDVGDTHTYELVNDADGRFEIDQDGNITVANGADLDYEDQTSHEVTVRVTDAAGEFVEQSLTIEVGNVNDVPEIDAGDDFSVSDRSPVTLSVDLVGDAIDFDSTGIDSYGGADQDRDLDVTTDGQTMTLSGNGWKSVDFPYTITEDTILEFQFKADSEGEIHGIGFDNDDSIEPSKTFRIHGTQDWGINHTAEYDGHDGEWVTYQIRVGDYFEGDFSKLVFVNDEDAGGSDAVSSFRNVRVYEDGAAGDLPENLEYTWEQIGGPEVTLSDPNAQTPSFEAPSTDTEMDLTFRVTVRAGDEFRTDEVTVHVVPVNDVPEIDAGDDIFTSEREPVSLSVEVDEGPQPLNLESFDIDSYGGADQDKDLDVTVDGSTIEFEGNGWKSIDFPYTVTEDTILEFQFRSDSEGEIHGIGFDTDNSIDPGKTFQIHGTQNWGINQTAAYSGHDGEWVTYRIRVGDYFEGDFDRMTFVNDHDTGSPDAQSAFRNIRVFEDGQSQTPSEDLEYTWEQVSGPAVSLTNANSATPTFEAPEVEDHTDIVFRVTVRDGDEFRTDEVTVHVLPVNDAPEDITFFGGSVSENAAPGTVVATASVVDPDGGDTFTYELVDDADGRFEIDSSGQVVVAEGSSLDHETEASHEVTVRATDADGLSVEKALIIQVGDVNEAPDTMTFTGGTVAENAEPGTFVASVSVTDPDAGETLSYELVDDAGGRFAIDASGDITVADGAGLDYESQAFHTITVRASDSAGNTIERELEIGLTDINEGPEGLSFTGGSVTENAVPGTVVARATVSDVDAGDGHTYELVDNAGGRFTIDADGSITVADGADLDHEGRTSHSVTVRATDSAGNTIERELVIDVMDVNETPEALTFTGGSVREDAPVGTVVATAAVTDPDAAESYSYELPENADGRFVIDGSGNIVLADSAGLDHESAGSHNVTVRVTDSGGNTIERTLTIEVADVNEAPDALIFTGGSVPENAASGTIVATVGVSDADAGDAHTYELVNDADGRFSIDETGNVVVAEGADLNHEADASHGVIVRVTDSDGNTIERSLTIEVSDVNETPTLIDFSGGSVVENAENGTVVASVAVSDVDADESFTYELIENAGGRFAIDSDGYIVVADGSKLDYEFDASHEVTVRVTDSAGNVIERTLTIDVTNVNEPAVEGGGDGVEPEADQQPVAAESQTFAMQQGVEAAGPIDATDPVESPSDNNGEPAEQDRVPTPEATLRWVASEVEELGELARSVGAEDLRFSDATGTGEEVEFESVFTPDNASGEIDRTPVSAEETPEFERASDGFIGKFWTMLRAGFGTTNKVDESQAAATQGDRGHQSRSRRK